MGILEVIKTEIERRMDKHWDGLPNADSPEDDWTHNELCELGAYKELEHLESFLDTLKEQEVDKQAGAYADEVLRLENEHPDWNKDVIRATAYHFFDLGCRHAAAMYDDIEFEKQRRTEQEPKGLDEAAEKYAKEQYLFPANRIVCARHFKTGVEWAFGQGVTYDDEVAYLPKYDEFDFYNTGVYCEELNLTNNQVIKKLGLKDGDKVIVQIRKKDD